MPEAALAVLLVRPWLAVPLAWLARARQVEPSSVSRIARGLAQADKPRAALRLVEASLLPFPADASLRRDRLRLLLAMGAKRRLAAAANALAADPALDGETAYLLWSIARDGAAGLDTRLAERLRARFTEAAPPLERARFARRDGRPADALANYRAALAATNGSGALLREAAAATLAEDAWPAGIDLIEAARDQALVPPEPRLRHAIAVAGRNPHPLAPLPRLLFEDLAHCPPAGRAGAGSVLMVGNSLRCGGMERVLAQTVAGLSRRGRPVALALADPPGESAASSFFLAESGVDEREILPLISAGTEDPKLAALPRRWRGEAVAIARHVRTVRPALVHAWNDRLGLIAALATLPAGVPIAIHLHHMRPTRDPAEAAAAASYPDCLRLLLDRPDVRLLFCAEAAADDYADWLGVTRDERFLIAHNGFPAEAPITPDEHAWSRRQFRLPAGAPVVAGLFRFEAVKQPLVWLDAASRIAAALPQARFVMAGDGELLPAARAHARALGLDGRVHFPGRVADPRAVLAAADLLLISSASEGLPNGAVEAQLAGVPVLAFDVGGTRETMAAPVTGRLVQPGRPDLLADAAIAWLRDPAALAAAGEAARAFATQAFGIEGYLDRIEAVYATLA